jgi:hypothetical protein
MIFRYNYRSPGAVEMNSRNVCLSFILLLAIIQASCASSKNREGEAVIEKEEAAVIRAYVDSHLEKLFWEVNHTGKPLRTIYVNSLTARFEPDWQKSIPQLSPAPSIHTVISFVSRNDSEYAINPRIEFSLPHRIIPEATIHKILEQKHSRSVFHREYPDWGGFIWLSRVGFNTKRTQALLMICFTPGSDSGEADLVLMQKDSGSWREMATEMLWIE